MYTYRYANDGGKIINTKIPMTGDGTPVGLWIGCLLLGIAGLGAVLIPKKRGKANK